MISSHKLDFAQVYENGNEEQQNFIQNLSLFFATYFKHHSVKMLETQEHQGVLLQAHHYLAEVSLVPNLEVWKICLEYWNMLVRPIFTYFYFFPSLREKKNTNRENPLLVVFVWVRLTLSPLSFFFTSPSLAVCIMRRPYNRLPHLCLVHLA